MYQQQTEPEVHYEQQQETDDYQTTYEQQPQEYHQQQYQQTPQVYPALGAYTPETPSYAEQPATDYSMTHEAPKYAAARPQGYAPQQSTAQSQKYQPIPAQGYVQQQQQQQQPSYQPVQSYPAPAPAPTYAGDRYSQPAAVPEYPASYVPIYNAVVPCKRKKCGCIKKIASSTPAYESATPATYKAPVDTPYKVKALFHWLISKY